MPREKKDKKRPSVQARKSHSNIRTVPKSSGRREKPANPAIHEDEVPYGHRSINRSAGNGISITVQIPPLRRPGVKRREKATGTGMPKRRLMVPTLAAAVAMLIAGVALYGDTNHAKDSSPAASVAAAQRTEPAYDPLVPSAETAGTTQYDGKRDLVTYTTSFNGARITVSQQSLPASFALDPKALEKAADNIKAEKRIETSKGPLVIATNPEAGNQMAIFADKHVLAFVFSNRKLEDSAWKSFIELLTAKSWDEVSKT